MENILKAIEQLNLNVIEIEEVLDSYSSTVRILLLENGNKVVLKIPFTNEKLRREIHVLELLSESSFTPNLLDVWYGDEENVGAIVMSFIEGTPMKLPIEDSIAYDMGKVLATLHSIEVEKFEIDNIEDDWWESVRNRLTKWINEIDGYIPAQLMMDLKDYCFNLLHQDYSTDGPCLVHFDYRPGNLLVNNGVVVGVIDFESSRGGSACIDFTKVAQYLWSEYPNTKQVFLEGYESIRALPDFESTLPVYLIHNAIGGIAWCVRRSKLDDPFYYENLKDLKDHLGY